MPRWKSKLAVHGPGLNHRERLQVPDYSHDATYFTYITRLTFAPTEPVLLLRRHPPLLRCMLPQRVLPTLLTRLRKGALLSASGTCYPCLLPFLASLSVETLLSPAAVRVAPQLSNPDQRPAESLPPPPSDASSASKAVPFCVQFLEDVWAPMEALLSPGARGGGGVGGAYWLVDVAAAHVECVAFLLLKLPSPAATAAPVQMMGGGSGAAAAAAAATANLSRATRSFLLNCEDDVVGLDGEALVADERQGQGLGVSRGLRERLRGATDRSAVAAAFGRALGQLHLGAERGAGVMGAMEGAVGVWNALLGEGIKALDERYVRGLGVAVCCSGCERVKCCLPPYMCSFACCRCGFGVFGLLLVRFTYYRRFFHGVCA